MPLNSRAEPGEQRIAGIAYAGDRGVSRVEFSTNGGATWKVAQMLEPMAGKDNELFFRDGTYLDEDGKIDVSLANDARLTIRRKTAPDENLKKRLARERPDIGRQTVPPQDGDPGEEDETRSQGHEAREDFGGHRFTSPGTRR